MQTTEVYFWLPPSLPVCMRAFTVSCFGTLSGHSERLVATELTAEPQRTVSGLIIYRTQTQDMSIRAHAVCWSSQGGFQQYCNQSSPPPLPFLARMMTYSSLLTNVTWFVLPFFLAFHAEAVRSGYAGRIRQNSMSVYKQPNAKFMSCGISCSVINYRCWFQVKKANCSPSSLLTLRDSLVIESNAVHELQHADKLDKSCRATLRLTCLGTFTFWREEKKKNKGHMQVKIYEAV